MGGQRGIIWGACGVLVAGVLASVPQGERDAKIAAVQSLLRDQRLYPGEVTGVRDRETEAAIRRFQMLHSLRVTGHLDEPTLARMNLLAGAPPPAVVEADKEFLQTNRSPEPPSESPPVAEAPPKSTTAPRSTDPISRETVKDFLSFYSKAASRKNPEPELTYYAEDIEYFDHGRVNREWLADELERSHRQKPSRVELLEIEETTERSPNTVEIRFTVRVTPQGRRSGRVEKREATLQREPGGALKLTRMVSPNR